MFLNVEISGVIYFLINENQPMTLDIHFLCLNDSNNLHLFIVYHKLKSVIEELRNMRHRPSPGLKEPEVKQEIETLMIKKLSTAQMIITLHDMKRCLL